MFDLPSIWHCFAQAAPAAAPAEEAAGTSTAMIFFILFAVFVLPFLIGKLVANALKLKDLSGKIGLVCFAFIFGMTPFVWQIANGNQWTDAISLGIDLAGGTNLVYRVDSDAAQDMGKTVNAQLMDQMVGAVARRLDPASQEQITVRRVGSDRIEVIIPGADRESVERKKRQMVQLGSLEFAILANQRDHRAIITQAEKTTGSDIRRGGRVVASWRQVGVNRQGIPQDVSEYGEVVSRDGVDKNGKPILDVNGDPLKQFLVIIDSDKDRVTGKYLTRVYQTMDDKATPAVGFVFNTRGGFLFQNLTSKNRPMADDFRRRLAILLDERVQSAPSINDVISGSGIISGRFDQQEIDDLISVLNAGALDVPIIPDPISEFSISPLLGTDVQEKGKRAILIAAGLVVVFMLVYYGKFAGVVADLCLVLNLTMVLGIMAMIDATFTLPGLAGIVLTIGMAVDANVLIFERIREETARGSSMRMAIQNGFSRALTTIVDANVTTLITAVVLYMIGTDQVRGFAVTLFIGIMMSMFTALFFGRLLFDICERKRWLTELKMMSVVGKTHWDFLSKKFACAILSFALIAVGMVTLISRGDENLDIDFSGGTMVTFEFVEDQNIDEVRAILQESLGTGITVEQLALSTEDQVAGKGRRFRLRSKEQDVGIVRSHVNEALTGTGHELRRVTVELGEISEIAAATAADETAAEETDDTAAADATEEAGGFDETPVEEDELFAGGRKVDLEFSGVISVTTVVDYLADEINKLQNANGDSKYDRPAGLIELTGLEGPGMDAVEGQARYFTKMELRTIPDLDEADLEAALAGLQTTLANNPIFDEINSFASAVAGEMQQQALMAMLASLLAIVAYIWFRFQRVTFGLAAVAALVHDVLIVLGMVALASMLSETEFGKSLGLYDFKINLPMIAAFLTIVGYSLNDTIVVFDRIREVRGKNPALTEDMVNTSLNQTLSRTILTSFTTFIVVLILYAIGGEGIHGFAFCLVLGVIVGTYSSIYVASPVLLWLMNRTGDEAAKTGAAA